MSNPFIRGTLTELSKKTNMHTLGDGEAKVIGYWDLSAQIFKDIEVSVIKVTTGTGTYGAGTLAELYIAIAEDAAGNFTDAIDETADTDQASSIVECTLAEAIEIAAASTTYYFDAFSIAQKLGRSSMPSHVALILKNSSATAADDLSATSGDHIAKAREITFA